MDSDNRILSQPNNHLVNYSSHHDSFMLIANGSDFRRGIVRHRKELWVEDTGSGDPYYRRVTIGSLPDDALLEIFKLFVDDPEFKDSDDLEDIFDMWHTLVHVCQRWRNVVFSSPRRLNLQLLCVYNGRPVRDMLNIWPKLPIVVIQCDEQTPDDAENFLHISALKLNDRVSRISLWGVPSPTLEIYATSMQVPFPSMTELSIWRHKLDEAAAPVLSGDFLSGSAPHLQVLWLEGIPFPALRKLLLSTIDLVFLYLEDIPHSGYISPEEMVACLTGLPRLDKFSLGFRSPHSCPSRASRRPHSKTRATLPALRRLDFKGVSEYLEDLVSRIDAPSLDGFKITLLNQLIFDIFQLPKFLRRTDNFSVLGQLIVVFHASQIKVELSPYAETVGPQLELGISCSKSDWQLSALPQLCISCLSTFTNLEGLDICEDQHSPPDWQDDIEHTQWAELLHPFTTVKDLFLSEEIAPRVITALQELAAERVTGMLPALEEIFLEGPQPSGRFQDSIGQFVTARQLSGRPVAIHLLGED